MRFKIAHLFLMSLLGIASQAKAIIPFDLLPPDHDISPEAGNIRCISCCERSVKSIGSQDDYKRHSDKYIRGNYELKFLLTLSIITYSELGLLYEVPVTLDQYKQKFTLHRTSNNTETHALAKIADITLANVEARHTHQEVRLNLFDQTREVLAEEMSSTNPFVKWMAYRVLARTAEDEGKTGQAIYLLKEALGTLPVKYEENVKAALHLLEARFNNVAPLKL
jgi:hypothetical protein